MNRINLLSTAAVAFALLAAPTQAEVLTLHYEGTLGSNVDWPSGVMLSGSVTYDTDAAPTFVGATFNNYPFISHTAELDGVPFVSVPGSGSRIQVLNDGQSGALYSDGFFVSADTTGTFADVEVIVFGLTLRQQESSPPAAFDSVDLPGNDENFAGFTQSRSVYVTYRDQSSTVRAVFGRLSSIGFVSPVEIVECDGFFAPFDVNIGLNRRERRVIPLRMNLFDVDGNLLTPTDIAAPAVSVEMVSGVGGGELESLVDSPGRATTGNSFVWNDAAQQWEYNLSTAPFSAVGTYTVTALSGDVEEYEINPTCSGVFVRQ